MFICSTTCLEDFEHCFLTIWSNQWIAVFYWFMFHPVSSRKIGDDDRLDALNALFAENGKKRFLRLLSYATFPKRLARPLILLAAKGFLFPAKVYFRNLYYPLIERRSKA